MADLRTELDSGAWEKRPIKGVTVGQNSASTQCPEVAKAWEGRVLSYLRPRAWELWGRFHGLLY